MTIRPVVIAGGGTAGHVFPAIATAEALVAHGRPWSGVHYIGAERGIETELVPSTPMEATFFDVVGLQRSLTPSNLSFLPRLIRASRRAGAVLDRLGAAAVVSVGGYASMPAVLAARRRKIPIVVISYDRRPGRASAITARWAAACAVAFEHSPLPHATMTGAPLRAAILGVNRERDRHNARSRLGIHADNPMVLVMGGSLGSLVLNDAVQLMLDTSPANEPMTVWHLSGRRYNAATPPAETNVTYHHQHFADDMADLWAACDLVIGRGGASTVHEVAATGTPALLVPWSGAADNHQRDNVAWLTECDAAVCVEESDNRADTASRIAATARELVGDQQRRDELAHNARQRGQIHHSGRLAELIESVALA